ncbi:helix-turn-helix domain-containing protein [Niveibacterium terrae]|uniref:helix-turn-helix domain-containing protein n=1 Tax=Niveibacterium terrae TaxID=3373598 RepID=UPI003A8C951B
MSTELENESSRPELGVAASGEALRQAREARGLSLSEVAGTLKLTAKQVGAIESETFEQLPGIAFARGFIRNYARLLGLDPAPLLERLELPAQVKDLRLAPESNAEGSVPCEPAGYRSQSAMPALLAVALIVLVGLAAWYFDLGKLIKPRLVEQPAEQSEPQLAASEPLFPPHTEETAVVTAQTEASAPVVEQSGLPAASEASAPAAQSAPLVAASAASVAKASSGSGLHFSFERDSWVEVRDASGKAVFSQLGKAGSSQDVLGQPPFSLVVGNVQSVKLEFNGRPVDFAPHTKGSVARLTLK